MIKKFCLLVFLILLWGIVAVLTGVFFAKIPGENSSKLILSVIAFIATLKLSDSIYRRVNHS